MKYVRSAAPICYQFILELWYNRVGDILELCTSFYVQFSTYNLQKGIYSSHPSKKFEVRILIYKTYLFQTGDYMAMIIDFKKQKLYYYKNNTLHGTFDRVKGKLFLTCTMRQYNRITIIPTIPEILLSQLKKTEEEHEAEV